MKRALLALSLTGCLRSTTFQCETSAQCGAEGLCEADNYCSFPSTSCPSGRVYGDNSGPHSNQCVDEAMPVDAMPDASNCPATYMALPNAGTRGHVYRLVDLDRTWAQHRDACAGEAAFLAFPDGPNAAMELAALRTAAGNGAWVGVNDIANEGNRVNSLNMPISAQTQALVNIDGNPTGTDCFVIDNTSLDDASCNDSNKAVCECVP
jgi:Lectin C-type domain